MLRMEAIESKEASARTWREPSVLRSGIFVPRYEAISRWWQHHITGRRLLSQRSPRGSAAAARNGCPTGYQVRRSPSIRLRAFFAAVTFPNVLGVVNDVPTVSNSV